MDLNIDPNNFQPAFAAIDNQCVQLRVIIREILELNKQLPKEDTVTLELNRTRLNTMINSINSLTELSKTSYANKEHIKTRLQEMVEAISEIEVYLKKYY